MAAHNTAYKAFAGKCGLETMNKKLTKLEIEKEAPENANASYAQRCAPFPDTKTDRQHQNIKYDKRTTYNRIPNC